VTISKRDYMIRGFCLSTGMNFTFNYSLQIFKHYWITMLTSAAGCLNIETKVFRDTSFALAFVYETKFKLKIYFCLPK